MGSILDRSRAAALLMTAAVCLRTSCFCAETFDVTRYGAVGDGRTLNTAALQRAIDAAAQVGGAVCLPAGRFLTGSLDMKSGVDLQLSAGSVLLGSSHRRDYRKGRFYALLLGSGQRHISISGPGTIDGQGALLAADVVRRWRGHELSTASEAERPMLVDFLRCADVSVHDVTLKSSSCWVQEYDQCEGLQLHDLTIESLTYHNNDGIDIDSCRNVRVWNCSIDSTDDGICLKSGQTACQDIVIEHCAIRSGANAFKCGTASGAGFKNIRVNDLRITDTHLAAVAIESVDGAKIEHVEVSHIQATHTGCAIFVRLGHRRGDVGSIQDVRISDLQAEVVAHGDAGHPFSTHPGEPACNLYPSSVTGLPGHPVEGLILRDITVQFAGGGDPAVACVPTDQLERVPEAPARYPVFAGHSNVQFSLPPPGRPPNQELLLHREFGRPRQ